MTETNWDKITDEKQKSIIRSQCLNIAFQDLSIEEIISKETQIRIRIGYAKELYYELMKDGFTKW